MKTYLVTGGLGFIGSNYIQYLFNKYDNEINIINIDNITYAGNPENLITIKDRKNYQFCKTNINNENSLENIFLQNKIDYVIHFAAESHVDRSIKSPEIFVKTNVLGTVNLLNSAKKHWETNNCFKDGKKFVHISTDEVYGSLSDTGYFSESTPLDPHSPYAASKASSDLIVKSYFDTYSMPINITRCSNNYGPHQFPEKLIPLIINNALNGKDLPVYGDGKNVRDWLYVMDHAKAIDLVCNNAKPGEIYNIGGNNEKQNIQIIVTILDLLNKTLDKSDKRKKHINTNLIKFVKDRLGHDRRYAIDASKIKNDLGWRPNTMFDEGIQKTISWYLSNENWIQNIVNGEYQNYYSRMYD